MKEELSLGQSYREAVGETAARGGREERMGDKEEQPFISPPKLIEATSA